VFSIFIKTKIMKKYITILPLFLLFVAASCSDQAPAEEVEEKEEPKALIEREPEVREYMEVANEVVEEYITVAETFLENAEKLNEGGMGTIDAISMVTELASASQKIQELNEEMEKLDERKAEIEEKLTAEDVTEFVMLYGETTKRAMELAQRVQQSDILSQVGLGSISSSSDPDPK
jgi:hypothetical protein